MVWIRMVVIPTMLVGVAAVAVRRHREPMVHILLAVLTAVTELMRTTLFFSRLVTQ
jgi:hypothetical protein